MKAEEFIEYIRCGREIEFTYDGKQYSITQGKINGKPVFSFCEFYKKTTEVENPEDLLSIQCYDNKLQTIIESLDKNDIWIY